MKINKFTPPQTFGARKASAVRAVIEPLTDFLSDEADDIFPKAVKAANDTGMSLMARYMSEITPGILTREGEVELGRRVQRGLLKFPFIQSGAEGLSEALKYVEQGHKQLTQKLLGIAKPKQGEMPDNLQKLLKEISRLKAEQEQFAKEQILTAKSKLLEQQGGTPVQTQPLESTAKTENQLRQEVRELLIKHAKLSKDFDELLPPESKKIPEMALKPEVPNEEALGKGLSDEAVDDAEEADEALDYVLTPDAKSAADKFTISNLKLVISIAKKICKYPNMLLDLIEEGNMGLMKAVLKFDPEHGCRFSTYGSWWIRQSITRSLSDKGKIIRIPIHMSEAIIKVDKTKRALANELGREPSREELAAKLQLKPEQLDKIQGYAKLEPSSYDKPVDGDEGKKIIEVIADEKAVNPHELLMSRSFDSAVSEAINTLPPKHQDVLIRRYGLNGQEPQTLIDIAESYHLTRERIRQIEAESIIRLRKKLGA